MKKKLLLVVPICAAALAGTLAVSIYAPEARKKPDSKPSADVFFRVFQAAFEHHPKPSFEIIAS